MLAAFYCRILFTPSSNILATPNGHSNVAYFILECRDMALPLAATHSRLCWHAHNRSNAANPRIFFFLSVKVCEVCS